MKQIIDPKDTSRAKAFELWMKSPMPMVTLTKTVDVTKLVRISKRGRFKFNMLLCWCIGKAASSIKEFFTIPENGGMARYDCLAINVIVPNKEGGISSCDIPFYENIRQFESEYMKHTLNAARNSESTTLPDHIIVGTSAMIQTELDSAVNQYTELFLNPLVIWGKYRKKLFRYTLPISFQFHHVQMDGAEAALFLERLSNAAKYCY